MSDVALDVDVEKYLKALDAYQVATGKDHAEILNHAERNIGYQAAHFTPAATKSQIRADLKRDPHLRFALTAIALKRKGIGALKKPQFAEAVQKFINRRAASARYLRAAFAQGVIDLGGTWRGRKFQRGASGFGNEATPGRLVAEIVAILNQPDSAHAGSAEQIGLDALNKAIRAVADDMLDYAQRRMQETASSYSG